MFFLFYFHLQRQIIDMYSMLLRPLHNISQYIESCGSSVTWKGLWGLNAFAKDFILSEMDLSGMSCDFQMLLKQLQDKYLHKIQTASGSTVFSVSFYKPVYCCEKWRWPRLQRVSVTLPFRPLSAEMCLQLYAGVPSTAPLPDCRGAETQHGCSIRRRVGGLIPYFTLTGDAV